MYILFMVSGGHIYLCFTRTFKQVYTLPRYQIKSFPLYSNVILYSMHFNALSSTWNALAINSKCIGQHWLMHWPALQHVQSKLVSTSEHAVQRGAGHNSQHWKPHLHICTCTAQQWAVLGVADTNQWQNNYGHMPWQPRNSTRASCGAVKTRPGGSAVHSQHALHIYFKQYSINLSTQA